MWEIPLAKTWDEYNKEGKTTKITGRFFHPKQSDELYDMKKDPNSINNLIDTPEYRQIAEKMRKQLTSWQLQVYDAGLMPESDIVRRAKKYHTTIYEMVRNPKQYNLKAYLQLSDLALQKDPVNLPVFMKAVKHPDCAIRYWGTVGAFLVADNLNSTQKKNIAALLKDDSHEVRGMAAWTLIKTGYQKKEAMAALQEMIESYSYALLSVLNILDWMGEDAKPLMPTVAAVHSGELNIRKMQRTLLGKFGMEIPEWAQEKK
jgi:hypothetical protein